MANWSEVGQAQDSKGPHRQEASTNVVRGAPQNVGDRSDASCADLSIYLSQERGKHDSILGERYGRLVQDVTLECFDEELRITTKFSAKRRQQERIPSTEGPQERERPKQE